jgi:hypothetical protein
MLSAESPCYLFDDICVTFHCQISRSALTAGKTQLLFKSTSGALSRWTPLITTARFRAHNTWAQSFGVRKAQHEDFIEVLSAEGGGAGWCASNQADTSFTAGPPVHAEVASEQFRADPHARRNLLAADGITCFRREDKRNVVEDGKCCIVPVNMVSRVTVVTGRLAPLKSSRIDIVQIPKCTAPISHHRQPLRVPGRQCRITNSPRHLSIDNIA